MRTTPSVLRRLCLAALAGWFVFGAPRSALAQSIIEVEPIRLGAVAVATNSAEQRLIISIDGEIDHDPGIIPRVAGAPGQFLLSGFAAFQTIAIQIDPVILMAVGGGPAGTFTVGFSYPPVVTTDGNGDATFDLGAVLTTSGDGTPYANLPYSGATAIEISW